MKEVKIVNLNQPYAKEEIELLLNEGYIITAATSNYIVLVLDKKLNTIPPERVRVEA